MSKVTRQLIRSETYHGRTIEARRMGPDLLCYVDGSELGSFYIDAQAAIAGGQRFVDADRKAAEDKARGSAR
jgi:hypothetical protein